MAKATPAVEGTSSRASDSQDQPKWLKTGKWLFWLSGWLVSLFLGLLDLPAKIVSFSSNAPIAKEAVSSWAWDYKKFEGNFSSNPESWKVKNLVSSDEPQIDDGQIQLTLGYDGSGKFSGEIVSGLMADGLFPWSRVMVDGKVGVDGNFEGEVWDIVNNQRAGYAKFELRVDDPTKGTLRLVPLEKDDGVFPGEIVLWPTDFKMADGQRGKGFDAMLKRSYEELEKSGAFRKIGKQSPGSSRP